MDGEDPMNSLKMPMPVAPTQEKKQDKTMTYVVVALAAVGVLALVAFFVLPMAIGTLFYAGALNPRNVTPTSCTFPPGLTCSSFKLHPDGSLDLRVGQATGHPINVTDVMCTQETDMPSCIMDTVDNNCPSITGSVMIPQGEQKWVSGMDTGIGVRCGSGGQAGEFYKGKLWIKYAETDTGMTRTVVGDLAAKYED